MSEATERVTGLSVREHMALQLAATPYRFPAVRESHAREWLGMSEVRHAQVVNGLLDHPEAEAAYPVAVKRLRRIRDQRRRRRRPAA